jgi:hypothetical protein
MGKTEEFIFPAAEGAAFFLHTDRGQNGKKKIQWEKNMEQINYLIQLVYSSLI